MFRLTQFAILIASVAAFMANPVVIRKPFVASQTARSVLLSESEQEQVLKHASDCASGECSIDEVSELLAVLKETEKELEDRLERIMNMVSHLQHLNEKDERQQDEVRAFVKDLLRVFAGDKPKSNPMGFSGDIGKGSMTAYDVLPPKKWKPSA